MFKRESVISRHLENLTASSDNGSGQSFSGGAGASNNDDERRLPLVKLVESNKISFDEVIEKGAGFVHRGKFIVGRSLMPSYKANNTLVTVLDDADGRNAIPLVLHNYFFLSIDPCGGSLIALMNPYLITASDSSNSSNNNVILRCDNPLHIVVLDANHRLVKNSVWKAPILPPRSSDDGNQPASSRMKKLLKSAENHISNGDYEKALKCYDEAIEVDPTNPDLFRLRAGVHLATLTTSAGSSGSAALQDIEKAIELDHGETFERKLDKAKVLYRVLKFQHCKDYIETELLLPMNNSKKPEVSKLLDRTLLRLKESEFGDYNLQLMIAEAQRDVTLVHGEYFASNVLEVKTADLSGNERGIIAKANIKAGTLLMAQKALGVISDDKFEKMQNDYEDQELDVVKAKYLTSIISSRLKENPELGKRFYNLHAGEFLQFLEEREFDESCPVIEDRILQIVDRNVEEAEGRVHAGVWLLPSFINQGCVFVNCCQHTIGDFMFVRAIRDIERGEALVFKFIQSSMLFEQRDETIRDLKGTTCKCRLCTLESSDSKETRSKVKSLHYEFIDAKDELTSKLLATGFNYEQVSVKRVKDLLKKARALRTTANAQALNLPAQYVEAYLGHILCTQRGFVEAKSNLLNAFGAFRSLGLINDAMEVAGDLRRCFKGLNDLATAQLWSDRIEKMTKLMLGNNTELLESYI